MEKLKKKLIVEKIIELAVLLVIVIIGCLPLTTFGFNFEVNNSLLTYVFISGFNVGGVFSLFYDVVLLLIVLFDVLKFIKLLNLKSDSPVGKYQTKGILSFLLIVFSFSVSIFFAVVTSGMFLFLWVFLPSIVFAIVCMIVKGTNKKLIKLTKNQ